ncbi:MAG TPA: hypothetical protein VKE24_11005, partial [Candidatus Acidoferrales bacterium]|nr:hypothetical protein [Candidatus Acidoferrales bacterium]
MSRRAQVILFVVLLVILVVAVYSSWNRQPSLAGNSAVTVSYQPLPVENPSLRLDLLERIRKLEYT